MKHKSLSFVDFLEALTRLACARYESETFLSIPQKIETFLVEYVFPRLPKSNETHQGTFQVHREDKRLLSLMTSMKSKEQIAAKAARRSAGK